MNITTLNWNHIDNPNLEILNLVSRRISDMEIAGKAFLPDMRQSDTIFIASDYGGEHPGSRQRIYSFMLIDSDSLEKWKYLTKRLRSHMYDPKQVIAYKKLMKGNITRAVPNLLGEANNLNGLIFSVGIDSQIKYISPDALDELRPDRFNKWRQGAYEKMLRVVHVVSMLLAGLTREGQDVVWLTDNDQIVANDSLGADIVYALTSVSGRYLHHKLGQLTVSRIPNGDDKLFAEDFASIPDLVAGALCELVTCNPPSETGGSVGVVVPLTKKFDSRAKPILDWHMDETQLLKRVFLEIGPTNETGQHNVYCRQLIKLCGQPRSPYII